MKTETIHWGKFVWELFDKRGISKRALAKQLNKSDGAMSRLFKDSDWRYSEILAASQLLNQNLFGLLFKQEEPLSMVMEEAPIYKSKQEEQEFSLCKERLASATELIETQKLLISELRRRHEFNINGGGL